MILAATNTDTASLSWAYVASAVGFLLSLGVFCAAGVWLLDRLATRHLRRHVNRALNNGDNRILRAVEQREQPHHHARVTTPRPLTERPHR